MHLFGLCPNIQASISFIFCRHPQKVWHMSAWQSSFWLNGNTWTDESFKVSYHGNTHWFTWETPGSDVSVVSLEIHRNRTRMKRCSLWSDVLSELFPSTYPLSVLSLGSRRSHHSCVTLEDTAWRNEESEKYANKYSSYIFTKNHYFLLLLLPHYTTTTTTKAVWSVCSLWNEICFWLTLCPLSPGKPGRPSKPRSPWETQKDTKALSFWWRPSKNLVQQHSCVAYLTFQH